jgi:uncharacterized protein
MSAPSPAQSPRRTVRSKKTSFRTTVTKVINRDTQTLVSLENGESVSLPPYLYISEGNWLQIKRKGVELVSVEKVVRNGARLDRVRLYPPYKETENVNVAPHSLLVTFRERRGSADLRAIKLLEQFHYRGNGLNKIVGRRTVIVAEVEGVGIVGYGVLSATVLACKPRFKLFGISLKQQMDSKLINKLSRIPRIVVHPEFRGLGLGSRIAKHLTQFAQVHWDIKGHRPVLIEVIASMTQYHKFFELAGFVNAGMTEGKSTIFKPRYGTGGWQSRPNAGEYKFFGPLGPKPYLVYPLTSDVERKVKSLFLTKRKSSEVQKDPIALAPCETKEFKKAHVSYRARNKATDRSTEIKTVFGITDEQMTSPVLRNFNLCIEPGDVVLATGGSGTGKSTLLKLLTGRGIGSKNVSVSGEVPTWKKREIASLPFAFDERLPLIDQIGDTLDESIAILNSVGLAEAHLYLKTPNQISEGQRYRFSIAQLCASKKKLWVADEFASTLDPYTAAVVAKGIRKQATKRAATLVVAAPHIEHFVESLLPTKLIRLHWGGGAQIFGIRLKVVESSKNYRVTITNTELDPLTDVRLSISHLDGNITEIYRISQLKGRSSQTRFHIKRSEMLSSSGLQVAASEKVGDMWLNPKF